MFAINRLLSLKKSDNKIFDFSNELLDYVNLNFSNGDLQDMEKFLKTLCILENLECIQ